MVVRGAPAIAIAAALALAVELDKKVPDGTPTEAAQLITDRLDYLVSRCAHFLLLAHCQGLFPDDTSWHTAARTGIIIYHR